MRHIAPVIEDQTIPDGQRPRGSDRSGETVSENGARPGERRRRNPLRGTSSSISALRKVMSAADLAAGWDARTELMAAEEALQMARDNKSLRVT
jgi:hypothetical protein